MKASQRFLIQVVIWLVIWLIFGLNQGLTARFLNDNLIPIIFQLLLIGALIFYLAPTFLFKKRYWPFVIISVILIAVGVYFSVVLFRGGGPPQQFRPHPPPPRYFMNFLLMLLSYLIAAFVETFLYATRKEEENVKNKSENLQTELKLLKSQINPHFLFNSLNNIYTLSVIDSEKTQESIMYLSDMLRYVLYECDKPFVPLKKEVDYIENYYKLFSLKSSKAYPVEMNFSVETENLMVAPMLFIPFIENAFKHSHLEKQTNSFVKINLSTSGNEILFEIMNSIPQTTLSKDAVGGIGLDNVKKRLSIIYPDSHELIVTSNDERFEVSLNIIVNGYD